MVFLLYFITGVLTSAIGTIPMGGTNISVVTTSKEESRKKAYPIIFGAGLGEMIIAILAVAFSNTIIHFMETNPWVQWTSVIIFLGLGVLLIFYNQLNVDFSVDAAQQHSSKKFMTGFLLGILNPMGLLYYILTMSALQHYIVNITKASPTVYLLIFFGGVFLGKWVALYVYSRLSKKFEDRKKSDSKTTYRIIGIILVLTSAVQIVRMLIE